GVACFASSPCRLAMAFAVSRAVSGRVVTASSQVVILRCSESCRTRGTIARGCEKKRGGYRHVAVAAAAPVPEDAAGGPGANPAVRPATNPATGAQTIPPVGVGVAGADPRARGCPSERRSLVVGGLGCERALAGLDLARERAEQL